MNNIFNSKIEIGLRLIFILDSVKKPIDIDRLIYYNYLVIHSSDIPNSPKSLHPDLPNRSCELLVTKKIVEESIYLLIYKGIVKINYSKSGIRYYSDVNLQDLIFYFDSNYAKKLGVRAKWVVDKFSKFNDKEMSEFINKNLGEWGAEFVKEFRIENE